MARAYAEDTAVSVGKSRDELERYLVRQGATGFAYGWEADRAQVAFTWDQRQIRLEIPLADRDDPMIALSPQGKRRSDTSRKNAYEQMMRQRHRAMLLIVKAKIEAIRSGVTTVDLEFGMQTVLPDGQTVATHVLPKLEEARATGRTPALLPPQRPAIEMGER